MSAPRGQVYLFQIYRSLLFSSDERDYRTSLTKGATSVSRLTFSEQAAKVEDCTRTEGVKKVVTLHRRCRLRGKVSLRLNLGILVGRW